MPTAAGDGAAQAPHDQNAAYRAVVSDLVSLVEHVKSSLQLIERTIEGETPAGGLESSGNIIVLDDVSPRYTRAVATLHACDVNLGTALRSLLDSCESEPCAVSLSAPSAIGA